MDTHRKYSEKLEHYKNYIKRLFNIEETKMQFCKNDHITWGKVVRETLRNENQSN